MVPKHHPDFEYLVAYAAGALDEPMALLIASHAAMCSQCAKEIRALEVVGGALLDETAPVAVRADHATMLGRLDAIGDRPRRGDELRSSASTDRSSMPRPLRPYLNGSVESLQWRNRGPVSEIRLLPDANGYETRLLKIRPGAKLPAHTHDGLEATLVIAGSFSDSTGTYGRGDVAMADHDLDHSPVAGSDETCICLAITTAPLRLTGTLGRLLNPFVRL